MDTLERFSSATMLLEQYADFKDFAFDGMQFLGFDLTEQQEDIAEYIQGGPRLRCVMAQRGEAKTTIAALAGVWKIIQRPSTRILIISAGEDMASQVATLIVRLFQHWDILECYRPDKSSGDKTSFMAFDVHHELKGLDKSPSVSCLGITSNLPGNRADFLIADDIESPANCLTVTQRVKLAQLTQEFTSICTHGDILYLGTPHSKDSVYNTLPGRGFDIRIWPGRYPTEEEEARYMGRLAPSIAKAVHADPSLRSGGGIDGSRGKPTDPYRYTEEELVVKELDKGPEGFQLQHMLDTSLLDAMRQQLRLSDLVVANFAPDMLPEVVVWQAAAKYEVPLSGAFPIPLQKMYYAVPVDTGFVKPADIFMYIDPAGGGVDEIGFAVGCAVEPYIHILDAGGLKGGFTPANERELCDIIRRNGVQRIKVESNMGHGLFETNLRAVLAREDDLQHVSNSISGEYSTGQKERRIIDSAVSSMQRHRVVVHPQVFTSDEKYGLQHGHEVRVQYSLWYQLSNITTDRNSLTHDDRVEAFAGVVREFKHVVDKDETKAAKVRAEAKMIQHMLDPMGYGVKFSKQVRGTKDKLGRKRYK